MAVIDFASSTGLWVKQVTTSFFHKGSKLLFKTTFLQKNIKWIAFLFIAVWLLGATGAYFYYQHQTDVFVQGLGDNIHRDILSGDHPVYQQALDLNRELSERLGPYIELNLADDIQKTLEDKAQLLNRLAYIEIIKLPAGNLPVARIHTVPSSPRIVQPISLPDTDAEAWVLPDEVLVRFSTDIFFLQQKKNGVVRTFVDPLIPSPLAKYRKQFIVTAVLGIPLALLVLLLLLNTGIAVLAKAGQQRKQKQQEKEKLQEVIPLLLATRMIWRIEQQMIADQKIQEKDIWVGPYLLKDRIGIGGMAEVFVAEYRGQNNFRKIVALKKILSHLADNSEFTDQFITEAQIAALLKHPNIIKTNNFGKFGDDYLMEMEYVNGRNLAEILGRIKSSLPVKQSIFIISEVCRGLVYAHNKIDDMTGDPLNIIHRDITPQNILISFEGEVIISDFGIAKAGFVSGLTQTGTIKGKVGYLAPEQVDDNTSVDQRTDLYALGIIFYELLSGKRLFRFDSIIEAIRKIPVIQIPEIGEIVPGLPEEVNRVVMRALEKDKQRRYQSAEEFLEDMEELKRDFTITYGTNDLSKFMRKHFSVKRPKKTTSGQISPVLWQYIITRMSGISRN